MTPHSKQNNVDYKQILQIQRAFVFFNISSQETAGHMGGAVNVGGRIQLKLN